MRKQASHQDSSDYLLANVLSNSIRTIEGEMPSRFLLKDGASQTPVLAGEESLETGLLPWFGFCGPSLQTKKERR